MPPIPRTRPVRAAAAPVFGLALAGLVALGAPRPARAAGTAAPAVPCQPAPLHLALLLDAGAGTYGAAADLVGRYTWWLRPSLGLGPELRLGFQSEIFGASLSLRGGDLAVAFRHPGPHVDGVLRLGLGATAYSLQDQPAAVPRIGAAAEGVAEASLVFHPSPCLGIVLGLRGSALVPDGGLGPWWGAQAVLGLAFDRQGR